MVFTVEHFERPFLPAFFDSHDVDLTITIVWRAIAAYMQLAHVAQRSVAP